MRWYEKVLIGLMFLLLSPIIIFCFLLMLISLPFTMVSNRVAYRKSAYYNSFKIPFSSKIYNNVCYEFYNRSVLENWPITYVKEPGKIDYFIYDNIVYIFPDFMDLIYNKEKNVWEVIFVLYKEKTVCSLDEYIANKKNVLNMDCDIKVLLSREILDDDYIDINSLPDTIHVIRSYSRFMDNESSESLSIIPSTSKELYELMRMNDKLCGEYTLVNDDYIEWKFEDVIYHIDVDDSESMIVVMKNNKFRTDITHWHPGHSEVYTDICNIGEKGNVLVIKTMFGAAGVCYMGNKKYCPIKKGKFRFGKVYFFEAE